MSKHYFEIKFVILGQLSREISVIVKVLALGFSNCFHLFIMVLSNVMKIRIIYFHICPLGKSNMSKHCFDIMFVTLGQLSTEI